jgi:hypothetical protein
MPIPRVVAFMRIIFASRSESVGRPPPQSSELNSKGPTRMALAGTPGPPGPPAGGRESHPPGYGPPSPPAPCRRRRLKPSLIIRLMAPPSSYRPRVVVPPKVHSSRPLRCRRPETRAACDRRPARALRAILFVGRGARGRGRIRGPCCFRPQPTRRVFFSAANAARCLLKADVAGHMAEVCVFLDGDFRSPLLSSGSNLGLRPPDEDGRCVRY